MSTWSIGSVTTALQNIIPNIPSAISGAQMLDIVDRQRMFMENYTGDVIGSTAIAEKYQPAMTNLSAAEVLNYVHLGGGDTTIGDIRLGQSAYTSAEKFRELGMEQLRILGKKSSYYKAYG